MTRTLFIIFFVCQALHLFPKSAQASSKDTLSSSHSQGVTPEKDDSGYYEVRSSSHDIFDYNASQKQLGSISTDHVHHRVFSKSAKVSGHDIWRSKQPFRHIVVSKGRRDSKVERSLQVKLNVHSSGAGHRDTLGNNLATDWTKGARAFDTTIDNDVTTSNSVLPLAASFATYKPSTSSTVSATSDTNSQSSAEILKNLMTMNMSTKATQNLQDTERKSHKRKRSLYGRKKKKHQMTGKDRPTANKKLKSVFETTHYTHSNKRIMDFTQGEDSVANDIAHAKSRENSEQETTVTQNTISYSKINANTSLPAPTKEDTEKRKDDMINAGKEKEIEAERGAHSFRYNQDDDALIMSPPPAIGLFATVQELVLTVKDLYTQQKQDRKLLHDIERRVGSQSGELEATQSQLAHDIESLRTFVNSLNVKAEDMSNEIENTRKQQQRLHRLARGVKRGRRKMAKQISELSLLCERNTRKLTDKHQSDIADSTAEDIKIINKDISVLHREVKDLKTSMENMKTKENIKTKRMSKLEEGLKIWRENFKDIERNISHIHNTLLEFQENQRQFQEHIGNLDDIDRNVSRIHSTLLEYQETQRQFQEDIDELHSVLIIASDPEFLDKTKGENVKNDAVDDSRTFRKFSHLSRTKWPDGTKPIGKTDRKDNHGTHSERKDSRISTYSHSGYVDEDRISNTDLKSIQDVEEDTNIPGMATLTTNHLLAWTENEMSLATILPTPRDHLKDLNVVDSTILTSNSSFSNTSHFSHLSASQNGSAMYETTAKEYRQTESTVLQEPLLSATVIISFLTANDSSRSTPFNFTSNQLSPSQVFTSTFSLDTPKSELSFVPQSTLSHVLPSLDSLQSVGLSQDLTTIQSLLTSNRPAQKLVSIHESIDSSSLTMTENSMLQATFMQYASTPQLMLRYTSDSVLTYRRQVVASAPDTLSDKVKSSYFNITGENSERADDSTFNFKDNPSDAKSFYLRVTGETSVRVDNSTFHFKENPSDVQSSYLNFTSEHSGALDNSTFHFTENPTPPISLLSSQSATLTESLTSATLAKLHLHDSENHHLEAMSPVSTMLQQFKLTHDYSSVALETSPVIYESSEVTPRGTIEPTFSSLSATFTGAHTGTDVLTYYSGIATLHPNIGLSATADLLDNSIEMVASEYLSANIAHTSTYHSNSSLSATRALANNSAEMDTVEYLLGGDTNGMRQRLENDSSDVRQVPFLSEYLIYINGLEERIKILEHSMFSMSSADISHLREDIEALVVNTSRDLREELTSAKHEMKEKMDKQKRESETQSRFLTENFQQIESYSQHMQKMTNQTSSLLAQLANKVSIINTEDYIPQLRKSLGNFTKNVMTLDDWKLKSEPILNATVENELRISRVTETMLETTHTVSKLHDRISKANTLGQRFYRSLKGHVIRLNNTLQDLREHVDRIDGDLKTQASKTYLDQLQEETKKEMALLHDTVKRADLNIFRLHNMIKSSDKTIGALQSDATEVQSLSALLHSLQKEVGNLVYQVPQDCHGYFLRGFHESGVYVISPKHMGRTVRVFCTMETQAKTNMDRSCRECDGTRGATVKDPEAQNKLGDRSQDESKSFDNNNVGGWTLLQRRRNGKVNFTRSWSEYASGFGQAGEEYWLGNDAIHLISSQDSYELRIIMEDVFSGIWEAWYDQFQVSSKDDKYRLHVNGYGGNASDGMSYSDRMAFSTFDQDNDASSPHCAKYNGGGWWYSQCHVSNLNGPYELGMVWFNQAWQDWLQMKSSVMMVRPKQ